jgi:hypothetical protein
MKSLTTAGTAKLREQQSHHKDQRAPDTDRKALCLHGDSQENRDDEEEDARCPELEIDHSRTLESQHGALIPL